MISLIPTGPLVRLTVTVEEAALLLGISRAHAYVSVKRGDLPAIRIGRRIVVPKIAVERMLTSVAAVGDTAN